MYSLDRFVISEHEVPERMNWAMAEAWADIPIFDKQDLSRPEWPKSPVLRIDVPGFENVSVMNEGDRRINEQGVVKNRASWEWAGVCRDYGRFMLARRSEINGSIGNFRVPRMTLLTSLNAGDALAHTFAKYNLPPPKLLVSEDRAEQAQALAPIADIYATNLDARPLSGKEISALTNNIGGVNLTSLRMIEPHATLYDWLAHYALNEEAQNVFEPYGSGKVHENTMTWQRRNAQALARGFPADRRLTLTDLEKLTSMNIIGVKPQQRDSKADKLTAVYNPFVEYDRQDHHAGRQLGFTGMRSGVYSVPEEFLAEGYRILSEIIPVEFSGAAGMGGLLYLAELGLVNRQDKHLVLSTGKGNFAE